MRIVVTGAHGMVGRAVVRVALEREIDVIALSRSDLDITDEVSVKRVIADLQPDAVLNCAAYTNVDAAESNQALCDKVNIAGVENLAGACRTSGSAFVTISTDYVFDGARSGFYTQRDTPVPIGVYARSKREGEKRAFSVYPRSIIVRTGWIFGRGGNNFLSNLAGLLAAGTQVNAISDCFGTPTYGPDLASRLIDLAIADLPGVYHVVNSGPGCSYYEFAKKICEIGGLDDSLVQAVTFDQLERPAPRPTNSRLKCLITNKLGFPPMPDWEAALSKFLGNDN
ncbi:MAG TPA: dTDP-4-dehydrorhamnose reductase [Pyrinomonadaceae bacterium]|nr:dTDP-4-dehydrorhamnose reductase [Pyrinomonadaceae bacterium]